MELFNLTLGLEVLEGVANGRVSKSHGDGVQGPRVELGVSLEDVKGALRGKGVAVVADAGNDFTLFRLGVGGDGKRWAVGWVCDGGDDELGGRCARGRFNGTLDEGDLRVGNLDVVDGGMGFDGRGHVGAVIGSYCCWKDLREWIETLCFFRPLLSCSMPDNGFFQ